MNKILSTLSLLFLALSFTHSANALSLGKAQLMSSLNQPLSAEIKLYDPLGLSIEDIRVGLASNEDQIDMGVEPNSIHRDLKFKLIKRNGELVVLIKSRKPVKEPWLEMVVTAASIEGEIRRKYSFTIDPPQKN